MIYPEDSEKNRVKVGTFVTLVGLLVNVVLTLGKYFAGVIGNSSAMIADATHSLSDLLTDFAVLLGLRYTAKPADQDHAYGHGRIETLIAALCGVVLFVIGLGIFLKGIGSIWAFVKGEKLSQPGVIALWAAVFSIVSKELLFRYTIAVGRRLNSPAMKANAWHHRTDALSSVGALLGIGGSILGGERWAVLDPITAVIVGVFILYAAADIFWNSIREVLDTSLAPSQIELIEQTALEFPEIYNIHKVRTRRIGFYVAVEAHIMLNGEMSLKTAHDIATALELKLEKLLGHNSLITLHTEPGLPDSPSKANS